MQQEITDELILELFSFDHSKSQGLKLLMEKYQRPLYHHIRSIVGSHTYADDVMQETLIKVYRSIGSFKRKSKLYTWLYRIATNESISLLNKEKKKNDFLGSEELASTNKEATPYFDTERGLQLLEEAVIALPSKQKLVFQMKYYDNLPYAEISKKLDTSVGALKASFHHAVKKIETFLEEKMAL